MIEQGFNPEDGTFRFHIPAEIKKSKDGKTWIEGIASVESPDLQGETILQHGMDLSYLIKKGFFNDNHSKETAGKVGIPTEAKTTPDGLYVRGYLLDTDRARSIVELGESLKKSGNDRCLGFSIEGKTKERDGKIIKKCWIKDVAITAEPVHPDTYCTILKSIKADIEENGYIEDPDDEKLKDSDPISWTKLGEVVSKSVAEALENFKSTLPQLDKALEAGTERPPETGGSALRKESLESDLTNLDLPETELDGIKVEEKEKNKAEGGEVKKLTKSQAEDHLRTLGYTQQIAVKMAEMIFDPQVQEALEARRIA